MGLAFLITSDNLQLLSERKVLKEAEYATMLDAAGLIEVAHREASRLREDAVRLALQDREAGYARGIEQARIDEAARRIDAAQEQQTQLESLRDAMARLVTKAVSQIVAQVDTARVYEAALDRIDTLVRDESFVCVRVAPADEAALRRALDSVRARMAWTLRIAVQADPALPPGDCVMQTASGSLELGVEAQLQALGRAVRRDAGRSATGAA